MKSTVSSIRCAYEEVPMNAHGTTTLHMRLVCPSIGSLLRESNANNGMCHFVEHLGFHTDFKSNKMSGPGGFGPDVNARTTACETVWRLDAVVENFDGKNDRSFVKIEKKIGADFLGNDEKEGGRGNLGDGTDGAVERSDGMGDRSLVEIDGNNGRSFVKTDKKNKAGFLGNDGMDGERGDSGVGTDGAVDAVAGMVDRKLVEIDRKNDRSFVKIDKKNNADFSGNHGKDGGRGKLGVGTDGAVGAVAKRSDGMDDRSLVEIDGRNGRSILKIDDAWADGDATANANACVKRMDAPMVVRRNDGGSVVEIDDAWADGDVRTNRNATLGRWDVFRVSDGLDGKNDKSSVDDMGDLYGRSDDGTATGEIHRMNGIANPHLDTCAASPLLDDFESSMLDAMNQLKAWAFDIPVRAEHVEHERKVILEEFRLKNNLDRRVKTKFWEICAPLVAQRAPIGTKHFIETVTTEKLWRFYQENYVAQDLCVICVVEGPALALASRDYKTQFTQIFNRVFAPNETPHRIHRAIHTKMDMTWNDLVCPRGSSLGNIAYVDLNDSDAHFSSLSLEILSNRLVPSPTLSYFRQNVVKMILSSCLDERFRQHRYSRKETSPSSLAQGAGVSFSIVLNEPFVEMTSCTVNVLRGQSIQQVARDLISEIVSCVKRGYTENEVESAKRKWRLNMTTTSPSGESITASWVQHYCLNEQTPMFPHDEEKKMTLAFLASASPTESLSLPPISLKEVNVFCQDVFRSMCASNSASTTSSDLCVLVYQGPKATEFQQAQLDALMNNILDDADRGLAHVHDPATVIPEEDDVAMNRLLLLKSFYEQSQHDQDALVHVIESMPLSGAILHSFSLPGTTGANTIRICMKKSTAAGEGAKAIKKVSMQAFAPGGATEIPSGPTCLPMDLSFAMAGDVIRESGLDVLCGSSLGKLESHYGTRVYLQRHLHHRGLGASSPRKELPLLLAMVLARLLGKNTISDHVVQIHKAREHDSILAAKAASETKATEALRICAFGDADELLKPHSLRTLDGMDSSTIRAVVSSAFEHCGHEFTFCFVGSFESEDEDDGALDLFSRFAYALLMDATSNHRAAMWRSLEKPIVPLKISFSPGLTSVVHVGTTITDKAQVALVLAPDDLVEYDACVVEIDSFIKTFAEALKSRLIEKFRLTQGDLYSVAVDGPSRTSYAKHARVFVSFSCAAPRAVGLIREAKEELERIAQFGFTEVEIQGIISHLRAQRAKQTDSHELFRLLEAFKIAAGQSARVADALSVALVGGHVPDDVVKLNQELMLVAQQLVKNGMGAVVVKYTPISDM